MAKQEAGSQLVARISMYRTVLSHAATQDFSTNFGARNIDELAKQSIVCISLKICSRKLELARPCSCAPCTGSSSSVVALFGLLPS